MIEAEAWIMIPKLDKDKTGCILDMHPLVLCKNCKHYDENRGMCTKHYAHGNAETWFCADGERRDLRFKSGYINVNLD